jgi:SAM-dependent methyltransferase
MNLFKSFLMRSIFALATYGMGPDQPSGQILLEDFIARCQAMYKPRVLELGTKRSNPDRSTRRDAWIPDAGEYLGSDIEDGIDVDIVADVHRLTEVVGEKQFDVIISCSTFEHFKYPHLAAHQIMKALKIGGVLFIQTHQTYVLHAYPYDYFRFSREALAGLFGTKMGFRVIATDYEFPARIYSPHTPDGHNCPAFLGVRLFGEKIGETPQDYVFEFDV